MLELGTSVWGDARVVDGLVAGAVVAGGSVVGRVVVEEVEASSPQATANTRRTMSPIRCLTGAKVGQLSY